MMRSVLIVTAILLTLAVPMAGRAESGNGAAPAFFRGLNDVPLMPGLAEMEEEAVIFDKPGGRIAESTAITETLTVQDIERFYRETLPQLGWRTANPHLYIRGDEMLTLDIKEASGFRYVRISIEPN